MLNFLKGSLTIQLSTNIATDSLPLHVHRFFLSVVLPFNSVLELVDVLAGPGKQLLCKKTLNWLTEQNIPCVPKKENPPNI